MPISISCFARRFTVSWSIFILACFGIALFITLGVWQIHRGQEKQIMLNTYNQSAQQTSQLWQTSSILPSQYQRIQMIGRYLPVNFFLDNQHHQHQFGYHVLTPFLLPSNTVVLVDRGWVQGDITRRDLPQVITPLQTQILEGYTYFPTFNNWILGALVEKKSTTAVVIERIDMQSVQDILHKSLSPFIMRLQSKDSNRFIKEWPTVSMTPQRHYAYALQWFALACVVVIALISLNLKKKI